MIRRFRVCIQCKVSKPVQEFLTCTYGKTIRLHRRCTPCTEIAEPIQVVMDQPHAEVVPLNEENKRDSEEEHRGVGRPSTVAPYAPIIRIWLEENPAMSGAEILQHAQLNGYRGGKSALYELVKRLRDSLINELLYRCHTGKKG